MRWVSRYDMCFEFASTGSVTSTLTLASCGLPRGCCSLASTTPVYYWHASQDSLYCARVLWPRSRPENLPCTSTRERLPPPSCFCPSCTFGTRGHDATIDEPSTSLRKPYASSVYRRKRTKPSNLKTNRPRTASPRPRLRVLLASALKPAQWMGDVTAGGEDSGEGYRQNPTEGPSTLGWAHDIRTLERSW